MCEKGTVAEAHEPPRKLGIVLRELAEGTSLHGLPKIVSASYLVVKILWLTLLLGKSRNVREFTYVYKTL